MAGWKDAFSKGIQCFRSEQYEQALAHFSEAISLGGQDASVYDSRAAVYEKLGKKKEALLDSKQVIYLAPDLWKGYARAARLFHNAHRYDSALKMVDLALERIRPEDSRRLSDLDKLRQDISSAGEKDKGYQRRQACAIFYHFGKLPVELATNIFSLVLEDNRNFVVVLAQVSREWRSVILGISAFWDTLVLTTKNPVRKAKIWKERSRGRLRKLEVSDGDMKVVWALNELHATPLNHLRELVLRGVRMDHFLKILPTCTSTVIRNLEYLCLDSIIVGKETLRFTEQAGPQLRHLIARNALVCWPVLARPGRQLQSLIYTSLTKHPHHEDLLWFLHFNPQLESLELGLRDTSPLEPSIDPSESHLPSALPGHTFMPSLVRLVLHGNCRNMPYNQLFASVSFPALRVLHLSKLVDAIDLLLSLLSVTSPVSQLNEISIESCNLMAPLVLVALLEKSPDLEILKLSRLGLVNPVIESLASATTPVDGGEARITCPRLSHAHISYCPDLKTGPIMRLVKLHNGQASRTDPGPNVVLSRITTLVLDGCQIDGEVVPWLRQQVPVFSCVYQTKKEAKWKR
ncbi:hypothetical protein NM688_g2027 [Phlebia brevispora]|uniref:Uncharacterized protein n=1 Tax=Phlebia brevispora TaxID=194682 RepID=A0ACC1T9N2_9APHY|nr:hypothetical protein NM688_g2027 [Phlebia brevispora]